MIMPNPHSVQKSVALSERSQLHLFRAGVVSNISNATHIDGINEMKSFKFMAWMTKAVTSTHNDESTDHKHDHTHPQHWFIPVASHAAMDMIQQWYRQTFSDRYNTETTFIFISTVIVHHRQYVQVLCEQSALLTLPEYGYTDTPLPYQDLQVTTLLDIPQSRDFQYYNANTFPYRTHTDAKLFLPVADMSAAEQARCYAVMAQEYRAVSTFSTPDTYHPASPLRLYDVDNKANTCQLAGIMMIYVSEMSLMRMSKKGLVFERLPEDFDEHYYAGYPCPIERDVAIVTVHECPQRLSLR